MDIKVPILAALIGALGGLVGGGVTTFANYVYGLQAKRQELLGDARRSTYVDWMNVRTMARDIAKLRAANKTEQADALREKYDRDGRAVMGRIAIYGGPNVVKATAQWYRTDPTITPCRVSSPDERRSLNSELSAHQAMRQDLMSDEELASDGDMSLLLLQCHLVPTGTQ